MVADLMGAPGAIALVAFTAGLVCLAGGPARADPPFGPAETLSWEGRYLGVTIGHAEMIVGARTLVEGETVWPILAVVKTDSYFVVWPVKNRFVTWWNPETHLVLGNEYLVDENHKRRRERIRYDRKAKVAVVNRESQENGRTEDRYPIEPDTRDLVAAILHLRERPLHVGDVEPVPVFTGWRTFVMKAEVVRKEPLEVPAGKFDAVVVQLETHFVGNNAATRLLLYFSDDERHLPLRLDGDFLFGSFVADLTGFQKGLTSR
jgi:hypothetical protein